MWFFTVTQHPIRVQQTHKYSKPTKVCHWSVRIKISFDLKFLKVFNLAKIVTNHPPKKEKGLFEGNQWVGAVGVGLLNSHEGWVEVGAGQKVFPPSWKIFVQHFLDTFLFYLTNKLRFRVWGWKVTLPGNLEGSGWYLWTFQKNPNKSQQRQQKFPSISQPTSKTTHVRHSHKIAHAEHVQEKAS